MPFTEREEDEVALPYHAAHVEQDAVLTRVHFGYRSASLFHHEDEDNSCWLGGLHAFQECFLEVPWCT